MMLLEPFGYDFMLKAMGAAGLVGMLCGILSVFIMLRGWSLIGDALSHSVVPGIAIGAAFGLSLSFSAFISGSLAALAMVLINRNTRLPSDAVIGLVFTSFLALGLFIISVSPTPVDVMSIIFGQLLTISDDRFLELSILTAFCLLFIAITWRTLMLVFFDPIQAKTAGLPVDLLQIIFFIILSAATIAAMVTVGAFLVIALVIIPGATAYLFCDRFGRLIIVSGLFGFITSIFGTFISYFLDISPGGLIVITQAFLFALAFILAPRHGFMSRRNPGRKQLKAG